MRLNRLWILIFLCFFSCDSTVSEKDCSKDFMLENCLPASDFRGTWVTNVASDALISKESIKKTVQNAKKYGINNLFVVVWNKGVTQYPSEVLSSYIGINQENLFVGIDPLKEIIEEAHKEGIKVHAWFEFGFSYAYDDYNSIWLKKFPEWAGKDSNGNLLKKNNFLWWNALHSGPQELLLKLISEVVEKYDIDGIQGDDRLPAMPSEGGYDAFSKKLYQTEKGDLPNSNFKDPAWVKWRADKLSLFGKMIYKKVKEIKPEVQVSWAPSIYPWSLNEYLQDWPKWLEEGYADFIIPQFYRRNLEDYKKIIDQIQEQVSTNNLNKIYAGVLSSLGNGYRVSDSLLIQMIEYHRSKGINGEVFFYYETFNR